MGARRLGQDEQYLTVREILSEASTVADGALSCERSDFYRFGYATLGFRLNPWLKLAFEILRQAGASLLLASLSFFFAFVVVYLALFYAQSFCVLPYDHSMGCNCLSRTIFCL